MSYLVKDYQPPATDYVAGKYRIVDTVGVGNMATVYEAEHAPLDRVIAIYRGDDTAMAQVVAVKMIHGHLIPRNDPTFSQKFDRICRMVAAAHNPNVITLHDWGFDRGVPYIVMPYCVGIRLRDLINNRAPLPLKQIWDIMKQICTALAPFHSQGLYHLGLSPENILVTQRDADSFNVQLFDMGIAGLTSGETKIITVDESEGIVGIPRCIAPEQVLGSEADARSDIYALGAMLYDMLVGKVPFTDDLVMQTTMCHLNQYPILEKQFTPEIECPEALKAVVLKSLDFELRKRFQSVIEFMAALTAAIEGVSIAEALVQAEQLLQPAAAKVEPEKSKRGRPIRFPSVRRRRLFADAGLTLAFGLALSLSVPYLVKWQEAWSNNSEEIARQKLLQLVLPMRREVQSGFERLDREQLRIDKQVSELRADLAMETSKPFPSTPAEQEDRSKKLARLKFELDTAEELQGALSNHVLSRSHAALSIRAKIDRAENFFRAQQYQSAQEIYPKATAELNGVFEALEKIRQVFQLKVKVRDSADAWVKYATATKRPTDSIDAQAAALRESANSMVVKNDFEGARKAYEQLLDLYGTASSKTSDSSEKHPQPLARAVEDATQRVHVVLEGGDKARLEGRYADAIKEYKAALELQPENAQAKIALADCYINSNRLGEAVLEAKDAVRIEPESPDAYAMLGSAYYRLDRLQEALDKFKEAVRLAPESPAAQLGLGQTLERMGDIEGARTAYREALKADPENKAAQKAAAALKARKG